jgi:hypothetical protein
MFKEITITELLKNYEKVEKMIENGFYVKVFKLGKLLFIITSPQDLDGNQPKISLKNRPKINLGISKLTKKDIYEERYLE